MKRVPAMKRTTLKFIAPPYSGRCGILEHFTNGTSPHSCTVINSSLSSENELFQVFQNPMANLCAFQLLLQKRSLQNYTATLQKNDDTPLILDHTPLELIRLHTVAYAQTRFISDFSFGLCAEKIRDSMEQCVTLEKNSKCDVGYIYFIIPPETCYQRMRSRFSEEHFIEESTLHNLYYLIHLHRELNPGKKLILNYEEGRDYQSAIINFYLHNIVKEVCSLKKEQY